MDLALHLISYDTTKNQIVIQTLPYLVKLYSDNISKYNYSKLSDDFHNQKALTYGLIVANKENGKFGVIDSKGNELINPRYNKIEFVESAKEFIVTNSSDKVGILLDSGKTKISVTYSDIKIIDSSRGLYLVNSNNKYGIINIWSTIK